MADFKANFWRKTITTDTCLSQDDFPASFKDSDIKGIDFSQFDIRNSNFVNAKITDCNFAGCDLMSVSFFGADLINCNFVGAKIWTDGPVSWHTTFPDDVSSCLFDDAGRKKLQALAKIHADAQKRADAWMKRNPIRQQWTPGGKLDSPWN